MSDYPTQEAYDAACRALWYHRDRADMAEKRAEQAEQQRDRFGRLAEAQVEKAEALQEQRDKARQEAAKLREAVTEAYQRLDFWRGSAEERDKARRLLGEALHSSDAPAGEPAKKERGDYSVAEVEAMEPMYPAPADRPEPSEALDALAFHASERIGRAEADRLQKQAESGFSQPAPAVPSDIARLANRCLWIAFAWNDHNFVSYPEKYAQEEARAIGIHDGEQAKEFMEKRLTDTAQPSESPAVPDGYAVLPKEPTEAMIERGVTCYGSNNTPAQIYRAMIAAAPKPDEDGGEHDVR